MVDEATARRLGALRDAWTRAWPQAWADPDRRADMIDLHAWSHALSLVVEGELAGTSCVLPSPGELAERIVRDELPAETLTAQVVPVMASRGEPLLRVERSRPAWHLSGGADGVPWIVGARSLVALAIDEGDNEVVALVDVRDAGVHVDRRADGPTTVRFDDVAVPEWRLVHRPDVRAALADRMTVTGLAAAIEEAWARASTDGVDDARVLVDLALCRAATHAAALTAEAVSPTSPSTLTRQHDVSAAAVVTLSTLARSAGVDAGDDLAWHRERLAPLV